jgi:hypothetical protein
MWADSLICKQPSLYFGDECVQSNHTMQEQVDAVIDFQHLLSLEI